MRDIKSHFGSGAALPAHTISGIGAQRTISINYCEVISNKCGVETQPKLDRQELLLLAVEGKDVGTLRQANRIVAQHENNKFS